jgi:hypothetical protein
MYASWLGRRLVFDGACRRRLQQQESSSPRRRHAELIAPGGAGHAGLVLVPTTQRLTRADLGRLVAALEARLVEYPGVQDLANAET